MQIVIDIPEQIKATLNDENQWTALLLADLKEIVNNGTPLPIGHGAIKDVSQIEIPMCEDRAYETWVQVAINAAPTIIEADRSEEE